MEKCSVTLCSSAHLRCCSAPTLGCPLQTEKGDVAALSSSAQGLQLPPSPLLSLRTHSLVLQESKLLCGTEHVSTAGVTAAWGIICKKEKKQTKIHLSCPRDDLELLLMGDALLLCQCALTNWCFSSCSLQTLLRSTTHNCPIISQKSHRCQQEAAAGGMETSLSSPFAGKVIWSLKL